MNHNHLPIILLLCTLLLQGCLTSCHTHKTITTAESSLSSTEIFRALAAHSSIDFVDTILFTPDTSPAEAPQKPVTNPTVSLPFIIRRHAQLTRHATVSDTTHQQTQMARTDSTSRLNNLYPYPSSSFKGVKLVFSLVVVIIVVSIAIGKFMVTRIVRRPQ